MRGPGTLTWPSLSNSDVQTRRPTTMSRERSGTGLAHGDLDVRVDIDSVRPDRSVGTRQTASSRHKQRTARPEGFRPRHPHVAAGALRRLAETPRRAERLRATFGSAVCRRYKTGPPAITERWSRTPARRRSVRHRRARAVDARCGVVVRASPARPSRVGADPSRSVALLAPPGVEMRAAASAAYRLIGAPQRLWAGDVARTETSPCPHGEMLPTDDTGDDIFEFCCRFGAAARTRAVPSRA
jgi:hypothetical protein